MSDDRKGMTVRDAGRKGGNTTKSRYGHEHYVEAGRKGGNKVRDMIRRAKELEQSGEEQRK